MSESKLKSFPKLLRKVNDNHPVYMGWFYFPNYSYPMLSNIYYTSKKSFKDIGIYHTFRIVSLEDATLVETVIIKKDNKYDLVYMYDIGVSTIYSFAKSNKLSSLKSKRSNLKIQKTSIENEISHLNKLEQAILLDDTTKSTKTCLLIVHGTCANVIFITSVIKALKVEQGFHRVDILLGFPYMKQCLTMHPCADKIWVSNPYTMTPKTSELFLRTIFPFDESYYDRVIDLKPSGDRISYLSDLNLLRNGYDMKINVPSDFVNFNLVRNKKVKIGYTDITLSGDVVKSLKTKFPNFIFIKFDTFDNLYEKEYQYKEVLDFNLTLGKLVSMDYVVSRPCDMLIVCASLGTKTIKVSTSDNIHIERYGKLNSPSKLFKKSGHLEINDTNIEDDLVEMFATIEIPS